MLEYNIHIIEGDTSNGEYKYLAFISSYNKNKTNDGCYIGCDDLKKLLEQCKQKILSYRRRYNA